MNMEDCKILTSKDKEPNVILYIFLRMNVKRKDMFN